MLARVPAHGGRSVTEQWRPHGHAAGDEVLRVLCRRLEGGLRAEDLVGRLGGEEFAVLLSGCDAVRGRLVAERLRRSLRETPIELGGAPPVTITASFGGAALGDPQQASADDLLKRADDALYAAKRAGRDRVEWAE